LAALVQQQQQQQQQSGTNTPSSGNGNGMAAAEQAQQQQVGKREIPKFLGFQEIPCQKGFHNMQSIYGNL
jgi:hypothetical protein